VPRVSVIIPTFDRARLVREAIGSVLAQTYQDCEIIVADDGSTDQTAEVVSRFGAAVTYLPLPHRGLPAATRNGGLRIACGEFIAFLDSDDLFLPHKLALQVVFLEAHPEAGMVYSNGRFFRDDPDKPTGHVQDGLPTPSGRIFADLLRGNMLAPPVVLIRRACLDRVGLFDEQPDFRVGEDFDLWLRIAAEFRVLYVPGDVAAIRRHSQSISRDVAVLRSRALKVMAKAEVQYPELMRQYRVARHEGYARTHGAVAIAELKNGHLAVGLRHGLRALAHAVQMPSLGLGAFAAWLARRRLRQGARP
jgi:glycosyltransferase involved in cell wall biosynthesis